jgi:hypothetical protein
MHHLFDTPVPPLQPASFFVCECPAPLDLELLYKQEFVFLRNRLQEYVLEDAGERFITKHMLLRTLTQVLSDFSVFRIDADMCWGKNGELDWELSLKCPSCGGFGTLALKAPRGRMVEVNCPECEGRATVVSFRFSTDEDGEFLRFGTIGNPVETWQLTPSKFFPPCRSTMNSPASQDKHHAYG